MLATSDMVCPQCAYPVRGLGDERCPECGFHFDQASLVSTANFQLDVIYTRLTWAQSLALVPLVTGALLALLDFDVVRRRATGSIPAFFVWIIAIGAWVGLLRRYSHEQWPRAFLPAGVLGYLLFLLHWRFPVASIAIQSVCLIGAVVFLFWTSAHDNRLANASAGSNGELTQVWRWTCAAVALGLIGLLVSIA